jgi:hypothetical protein
MTSDPIAMGRGRVSLSRLLSLLLGTSYVIVAFAYGDFTTFIRTLFGCAIVLACIWCSEAMGDFTTTWLRGRISRPSPPALVWLLGWIVLLIPLAAGIYVYLKAS